MALPFPCLAMRGSNGISLGHGPPSYEPVTTFPKDVSNMAKAIAFSPQGRYFACTDGTTAKILVCDTWKVAAEIKGTKISGISFSSRGTYFVTWEQYTTARSNPQDAANLHIWRSENGELVKSFVRKRAQDWQPQWSMDEKICGMFDGPHVILYEDGNFDKYLHRISVAKIVEFSISPCCSPYYIICYTPAPSGGPSVGRLFQYPKFGAEEALASKFFFQADKMTVYWNNIGTSALLMTSTEVDKTGASYYGKQALHYLSTKSQSAIFVTGGDGPIHAVQWSPKNTEFCVVYGFMPAKVTLFNLKCERIFEFGNVYGNGIHFNPQGNILILSGFGNLRGEVSLWDVSRRKLIAKADIPDTTVLQWSPDGKHFMTATLAPRLRVSNGFKIWHYTGTLLYERPWNELEELWEVLWQTFPPDTFPESPITYKAVEGITPSQPQASKEIFRPSCRGDRPSFKLHGNTELAGKPAVETQSKALIKNKKRRDAKKSKKESESVILPESQSKNSTSNEHVTSTKTQASSAIPDPDLTDDTEKNKKIKKIKQKLDQISKLKEQLSAGKQLEINQLDKIKKEAELLKEFEELVL